MPSSAELRCFISFNFGLRRARTYADELRVFLVDVLEMEILTGESYEPRNVTDKVRDRLAKADFAVALIVNGGNANWIRDETALLLGKDRYVIPLVERGATYDRGIFRDHEFVPFTRGHVSDTFLRIKEAVDYLRGLKSRKLTKAKRTGSYSRGVEHAPWQR